ncbi:MAG TPA: 23S rRNA (uracil(1939)-C(5))-methyltransferase RlmD [Burkholderiaceae bacterium]|nr:23S rRNA (uracil(1939)-C(5))-methyltransferase RlmD [Burkholderiaceae bacterium]
MDPEPVDIESLDLEGRGVGRRGGKVVFVDGALPRERVKVRTTRAKPSYETATCAAIERRSVERREPPCPHFGFERESCGGCSMQHLAPQAQVAIKQRALEDALRHIGRLRPETMLRPIAGQPWGYRHRARLSVRDVEKKGGVLVGFHERASSHVADMRTCLVLPPRVAALLPLLRALVESLTIRRRMPQIEVGVGANRADDEDDGGDVILVFRVLEPPSPADLRLLRAFGDRHRVRIWLQAKGPETASPMDPADAGLLRMPLPEFDLCLEFGPTDFTQVNPRINEVLVRSAVRLLAPRPESRVVDFFCGLGNFTLPLARQAARVAGFEGSALLVDRARAAAAAHGLSARTEFASLDLFAYDASAWDRLNGESGPIDRVLVDPPREGALAIVRVLAATTQRPERLVYVSCNPATLARDAAVLVHEGGWRLMAAGVVNMFPQTSHVESIALLQPDGAT